MKSGYKKGERNKANPVTSIIAVSHQTLAVISILNQTKREPLSANSVYVFLRKKEATTVVCVTSQI